MSKDLPGGGVGRGLQVEIGNGWGVDRELRWAERGTTRPYFPNTGLSCLEM